MGWGWSGLSSCHQSAVPHTDALLPHPAGLLEPGAQCSGLWGHPACLVLLGTGDNNTYLTGKVGIHDFTLPSAWCGSMALSGEPGVRGLSPSD